MICKRRFNTQAEAEAFRDGATMVVCHSVARIVCSKPLQEEGFWYVTMRHQTDQESARETQANIDAVMGIRRKRS